MVPVWRMVKEPPEWNSVLKLRRPLRVESSAPESTPAPEGAFQVEPGISNPGPQGQIQAPEGAAQIELFRLSQGFLIPGPLD